MNIQKVGIKVNRQFVFGLFLFLFSCFLFVSNSGAEVLERVIAIVNDDVILLSEFEEKMMSAKKSGGEEVEEVMLDGMINKLLLLQQAKKLKMGNVAAYSDAFDNEIIIDSYLQRRIEVLIHVQFEMIDDYYFNNKEKFGNKDLSEVRDEIDDYLREQEFNRKIEEHINDLRKKSYIRKQLQVDRNINMYSPAP